MNFKEISQLDQQYIMHTYGRFDLAPKSGSGAVMLDTEGKEYVDFGSGIGVNALGYCDPEWVETVTGQVRSIQHFSNYYYCENAALVAQKLCLESGMARMFFSNSGAEANEGAIKLARKYSFDKYGEGRGTILSLNNSFHGRTIAAITATGQPMFHQSFLPFPQGFAYAPAEDLEAFSAALTGDVCAVILEAIQGEGGVVEIDLDFLRRAVSLCREKDILVIFDEVQAGMGRTGKLFAYQHAGVVPDVVTVAKGLGGGLPIGGFLCAEALKDVMGPSSHGSTFGANPVSCAGARVVLSRICAPGFLEQVAAKGEYMRSRLAKMPHVSALRGRGLMIGVELESVTALEAEVACLKAGLLTLTAKSVLRLLPPLTITMEEIDRGLAVLEGVLQNLSNGKDETL